MSQLLAQTSARFESTRDNTNESIKQPSSIPGDLDGMPKTKVSRGQSKGIPEWNTGVKIHIQFNPTTFQPVGERASQFKSQLGQIVHNGHRIPLNLVDWKCVGDDLKQGIWDEVKKNLVEVPEGYKESCLENCNLLWKNHKSKTKLHHYTPHKNDPELSSKNPQHIVAEQWSELVAYWSSEDARVVSERNSINRELRGPCHKTGGKHFAQVRHEKEYEEKLRKEPEDQQKLTIVKDRVFHFVLGDDSHGYCRTFGSGVPRNLVYPKESTLSSLSETLSQNQLISSEKLLTKYVKSLKARFSICVLGLIFWKILFVTKIVDPKV